MKYTININQLMWTNLCPQANFRHALVLEAIKSMCHSESKKIMRSSDGYTWVASRHIIREMPLLNINTKAGLSRIIKELHEWGMIDIKKGEDGKNLYKITEKAERLDRDVNDEELLTKINGCKENNPSNSGHPFTESNEDSKQTQTPRKQTLTNHYTIDPYTIDPITNKNGGNSNELPPSPPKKPTKEYPPEIVKMIDKWERLVKKKYPKLIAHLPKNYRNTWAEVFRKLVEIDKRDVGEINKLIDHCFDETNSWWAATGNIQTPLKLRRRNSAGVMYYDVILGEMNRGGWRGGQVKYPRFDFTDQSQYTGGHVYDV